MNYVRSAFEYITKTCCCITEDASQDYEPNERSHLLADPDTIYPLIRNSNSDEYLNEYSTSVPKKDEQTALTRIVQDTATNIIDAVAFESHVVEQNEYLERVKSYNSKINKQLHTSPPSIPCLLRDVPNPEILLSLPPISKSDYSMMRNFVINANTAMEQIKVDHKEDLVVQFLIP